MGRLAEAGINSFKFFLAYKVLRGIRVGLGSCE